MKSAMNKIKLTAYLDFILSPFYYSAAERVITAANRVIAIAEQAVAARQSELLNKASEILCKLELPRRYEQVSIYFEGVSTQNFGKGNDDDALNLLKTIRDDCQPVIKARSYITAGSIFLRNDNPSEAYKLYMEASRAGASVGDHYATFLSATNMATVLSMEGDHAGSLALLKAERLRAEWIKHIFPGLYLSYINSLSYELCLKGELAEARRLIEIPLASSIATEFPEFVDTKNDIELRISQLAVRRHAPTSKQIHKPVDSNVKNIQNYIQPSTGSTPLTDTPARVIDFPSHAIPQYIPEDATLPERQQLLSIVYDRRTTKTELGLMLLAYKQANAK
jgi:hypothetical protein